MTLYSQYREDTTMMQVESRRTQQVFWNGLLTVLISTTADPSTLYLATFEKFSTAVKAIDALYKVLERIDGSVTKTTSMH